MASAIRASARSGCRPACRADWRPYEYGHWVYTDEWGWYWVSDDEEDDWGWVTYHYGRWAFDRGLGWFWVPGDEWAPAWVDWRYGDDYVGWAPLPPDELIDTYDSRARLLGVRARALYRRRRGCAATSCRGNGACSFCARPAIINRTLRGARPAACGQSRHLARLRRERVRRAPLHDLPGATARVRLDARRVPAPSVCGPTTCAPAARAVRPASRPRHAVSVQRTTTVIHAGPSTVPAPKALGKGERGQLGSHPPRAAQGGAALRSSNNSYDSNSRLTSRRQAPPTAHRSGRR